MSQPRAILIFFIMFSAFSALAGFDSFVPVSPLSSQDLNYIQESYQRISSRLPLGWKNVLPQQIGLGLLNRNQALSFESICKSDGTFNFGTSKAVFGYTTNVATAHYSGSAIFLHPDLLRGKATTHCTKAQIEQLFYRTLVHEMSHVYDYSHNVTSKLSQLKSNLGDQCRSSALMTPYDCLRKLQVSDDMQFLYLAGFKPVIQQHNKEDANPEYKFDVLSYERMNIFTDRSPRSYEYTNPMEYFAVNMELFIFDSEYKCRRPAMFQYLKNHFQFDPFPEQSCNGLTVMSKDGKPLKLDPSKIYSVHYIELSPGSGIQSRWGHSLIRLVICSPQRKTMGPECLLDTNDHLIVDFSAQLFDEQLSLWKGLVGQYPSGVRFNSFKNFKKEALLDNERDFESIPLNFTKQEINFLTASLTEEFWGQLTPYYFVQNNCSTQVFTALMSALQRRDIVNHNYTHTLLTANFISTPNELKQYLYQTGLANSPQTAEQKAQTHFSSAQNSLMQISRKYKSLLSENLQEVSSVSPNLRQDFYKKTLSTNVLTASQKSELKNAFIQVEQVSSSKTNAAIGEFFTKIQMDLLKTGTIQPRSIKSALVAQNPLWDGYGVPQNIDQVYPDLLKNYSKEVDQVLNALVSDLTMKQKAQLNQLRQAQAANEKNVLLILQM